MSHAIRRRLRRAAAAAVVLALIAAPHVAAQQPLDASGAFADAEERFEAGDYGAALALFEAARAAGADEPAVHYNIGVCQYRLADYDGAAATFRMLGERFPEMRALADYNLGLARFSAGRTADAREAFSRAAQSDDTAVAELAERMLARTAAGTPDAQQASAWTRYVELQAGHDDNVLLVEEASLPAGRSGESPFVEVLGVASGEPFGRVRVALDMSGYLVRYSEQPDFDQEAMRLGARYLVAAGAWSIEAGPHYDTSRLNGEGFEKQLGASVRFTRSLGAGASLDIRLQHDDFDELEPEFDYVRGSRDRLRLGLERDVDRGSWRARFEHERNDRLGPEVSADRNRLAFDYEHYLGAAWSLELGVAYRTSRYARRPRNEDLLELNAVALRLLPAGWLLKGELRWSDNDATFAPLDYQRTRFGVGIAKIF